MTLALRSRPSAVTDSKWPASTSRTSEVTKTVNGGARTLLAACGPASRARIGSAYAMVSFVIERPTDAFGASLDVCGPRPAGVLAQGTSRYPKYLLYNNLRVTPVTAVFASQR